MDTAATANDSAVWTSRGWQDPGISVYQFFLALSLVEPLLTTWIKLHVDLLYRNTLEEQIHSRTTH